jgi:hypothetical protein
VLRWAEWVGLIGIGVAAAATPESVVWVAGSTEKVCQPLGEMDWETRRPTSSQTVTRYGLFAVDLGYSFVHHGKLFFLFGDSMPSPKFRGRPNLMKDPPRVADDNDAIGFASDARLDPCLKIDFYRNAIGAYANPVVLNERGQPAITLRTNEMPIAGISVGERMYVIFGTGNPYANPAPPAAPNLDSAPTLTVMAASDDDGKTFHDLYDFSRGPDAKFINTAIARGPDGYLYFWGTQGGLRYRRSAPFFARKKAARIAREGGMEYFAGIESGAPRFSESETDAVPLFVDHLAGSAEPNNCVGELGVEWNRFVRRWVMLYNCANRPAANPPGIYMRSAEHAWGPWSEPQTIFNAVRDGGYCRFIHRPVTATLPACDKLNLPGTEGASGGNYGPYFLAGFTTGDEKSRTSTFYFLMSTWNPYGQVIMKTSIAATGGGSPASDRARPGAARPANTRVN